MSYKLATAYVEVQANATGLTAGFGKVRNAINGLLSGFLNMNPVLGAIAGIGSLTIAMHQLMNEAANAMDMETRLENTIRNTGNAAKVSKEDIFAMSRAMQDTGISGSTEIAKASTKLLQLKAVTKQTYPEIIRLSADVAAAGFGTVESAASALGRAMSDPANGMRRLRSLGLTFTKAEQEKIRALTKSNNLFAAQRKILDKVAQTYGGMDQAMAKTPAGQWKQIKNQLSDISQEFGMIIYPAVVKIGRAVVFVSNVVLEITKLAKRANDFLGGWPMKIGLAVIMGRVMVGVIDAINSGLRMMLMIQSGQSLFSWVAGLKGGIAGIPKQLQGVYQGISKVLFGFDKWDDAMISVTRMPGLIAKVSVAWKALIASITTGTIMTGWGAILVGIGVALVAIISSVTLIFSYLKKFPAFNQAWEEMWNAIAIFGEQIWDAISMMGLALGDIVKSLMPEWIKQLPLIKTLIEQGIVPAIVKMIQYMSRFAVITGATFKVMAAHLAAMAPEIKRLMSGDIRAIPLLGEKARKSAQTYKMDLTKEVLKGFAELEKRGKPGSRMGQDDSSIGGIVDTNYGMVGLQDAWRNVQESLLKKESPAERTAAGVEGLKETADKILEEMLGAEPGMELAVSGG